MRGKRLEQEIAELFTQAVEILAVERVEQLVGLLEHEGPERPQRLLAIPWTAVRAAQRPHDPDKSIEARASRVRVVLRGTAVWCISRSISSLAVGVPVSESSGRQPAPRCVFVLSLASNAAVHFGDLPDPVTNERRQPELDAAAQLIEIIAMLEEKTRGNLSAEERQLIDQVLFELRMRFVEAKKAQSPIIQP